MAKKVEEKKLKAEAAGKDLGDAFADKNKIFLAAGLVTIILGFLALSRPPVNGFVTMSVAPTLLVLGFLVLIPVGIVLGNKKEEPDQQGSVPR
jgi:uncharacterized membrane protein HdeD (DUF308 family)